MLSVLRHPCYFRPLHIRSYAKLLGITPPGGLPEEKNMVIPRHDLRESASGRTALERAGRVDVKPDHGLWHFFRKKEVNGEIKYETLEPLEDAIRVTGRSWTAPELRRKSFADLHTLWYVVLRERNLIATQKEDGRRMALSVSQMFFSKSREYQCRKTMARIKCVLNERRLAYEGALQLLAKQKAEAESKDNLPNDDQQKTTQKSPAGHRHRRQPRVRDYGSKEVGTAPKAEESLKEHGSFGARRLSGLDGEQMLEATPQKKVDLPVKVERVKEVSTTTPAELAAASLFAPGSRSIHP